MRSRNPAAWHSFVPSNPRPHEHSALPGEEFLLAALQWLASNRRGVIGALAAIVVTLVAIGLFGQIMIHVHGVAPDARGIRLFDLNGELNVPALYSALLLLFAAALCGATAVSTRRRGRSDAGYWAVLTAGFAWMAIDEALVFHERLVVPIRDLLGNGAPGVLYFAWVIPGMLLVVVALAILRPFLLRLPALTRRRLLVAAVVYLAGALGLELLGGAHAKAYGMLDLTFALLAVVEESLEMMGLVLLAHALLAHHAEREPQTHAQIRPTSGATARSG